MTYEEFDRLKIGDMILFECVELTKVSENIFRTTKPPIISTFLFGNDCYECQICPGDVLHSFEDKDMLSKISLLRPSIESLLSEKKELEAKIKNIDEKISAHKETVLNDLVPDEWYKIQTDYSSGYFVRKFVKCVDRGDGEIYLISKYQTGQDDSLQKKKIKSIIHIPGAKEAEETFLNMLKG